MSSSQQSASPEGSWSGWASKDPDPEEQGKKPTIEAALRHAYQSARDDGAEPPFSFDGKVEIHGNNPISDYKVTIRKPR